MTHYRSDIFRVRAQALSADEEKELGRSILSCEREARRVVRDIPLAEEILSRKSKRPERTRAGRVDRLLEAIEAVEEAARDDESLRDAAREARQVAERAHEMRWRLALSARRVVRPEARKISGPHLDEEDLIAEGYIGLHRAAKRFDPERGIRFATYARWWARAQMTRAVDAGGRTIRLPGGAVEVQRKLRRLIDRIEGQGDTYTIAELAEEVGVSEERARELLKSRDVTSLESPIDDGPRSRYLHEVLADESVEPPDQEVAAKERSETVRSLIEDLPDDRQRYILVRRYGLEDGEFRTLAAVGRELGISRERARQIEKKALKWLRDAAGVDDRQAA